MSRLIVEIHPAGTNKRYWQWRVVTATDDDPIAKATDYSRSKAACLLNFRVFKQNIVDAEITYTDV